MRRGDLWWADLTSEGPHPVVLVSRDGSYERRRRATVALVTSRVRGLPSEVLLDESNGLDHPSAAITDELRTLRLSQLIERIGALDGAQRNDLDAALRFTLGPAA